VSKSMEKSREEQQEEEEETKSQNSGEKPVVVIPVNKKENPEDAKEPVIQITKEFVEEFTDDRFKLENPKTLS